MTTAAIAPATKYRVAIRDIARKNGWAFAQTTDSTDRFERKGTVIEVHHGPSNLITRAEMADGKSPIKETARSGKMFDVQAWLTGQPDPNRERFIRLTADQIEHYESGQGIAKIAASTSAPAEVTPPAAPAKPAPRKAAPKAEAATPAPKPVAKPKPRAAKTATAAVAK